MYSVLIMSTVAIAGYFINYVVETRPGTSTSTGSKFLSGAQGAFAVGRVLGTVLMKFVRPRYVLLAFMAGATIFLAPATSVNIHHCVYIPH
jgi:FHS family L-fucose permease-like MFS transporter